MAALDRTGILAASAAAVPAMAADGPSSRVTGSPRWFVRVHRTAPPGGYRVSAA
jgi:hypothetical protein